MTLQAIQTRYYSPGNVRCARVKAWCMAGTIWLNYDPHFSLDENKRLAVIALRNKLQWDWVKGFVQGTLPNGDDCFVIVK